MTVWYNKIMDCLGVVFVGVSGEHYIQMSDTSCFKLGGNWAQQLVGARWTKLGEL